MPFGWGPAGLSAGTLAALATIAATTVTALYVVGRRPRRVIVPFVALWVPAAADTFVTRWARRLRRVGSLILQLAILSTILFAAGDLVFTGGHDIARGASNRWVVILIDRSASMQATDEKGSRLTQARARARAIIDDFAPGERGLVAAFASEASASSGWDSDQDRLKAAVDSVAPSDQPGQLGAALVFARELLRGHANATLIVIGDGGGAALDTADAARAVDNAGARVNPVDIRFEPVGRRRDNVGFVAFSARRLPGEPSSIELVLVTQSFKAAPVEIMVTIIGGTARIPIIQKAIRLEPGGRVVTTVPDLITAETRFEATIEHNHDDLSLDDHAYAVVPRLPPLSVLVVGRGDLYLDGALLGLSAGVRVDHVRADGLEQSRSQWALYDTVIFDGVTPQPAPEMGRYLYLDPHGTGSPWPERGQVKDPVVTDVRHDHPLVKQLALSDLNVETARRLALRPGDVAVAAAAGLPLIIARERLNLRQVAVAFDVRRSDLPLRSAFPLLIANTLNWLAHRSTSGTWSFPSGRTTRVDIEGLSSTGPAAAHPIFVDIVTPDGRGYRTAVVAGGVTINLDRVGIVGIYGPEGSAIAEMAVNLASPLESDTAPRSLPRLGGRAGTAPDGRRRAASRELWLAALVIALGMVTLEWMTFHRRLTV